MSTSDWYLIALLVMIMLLTFNMFWLMGIMFLYWRNTRLDRLSISIQKPVGSGSNGYQTRSVEIYPQMDFGRHDLPNGDRVGSRIVTTEQAESEFGTWLTIRELTVGNHMDLVYRKLELYSHDHLKYVSQPQESKEEQEKATK